VMLNTSKTIEGILEEVTEEGIVITNETKERVEGKKKKIKVNNEFKLPFDEIKETKIIVKFK